MSNRSMVFKSHILELRRRLIIVLGTVLVFSVAGYFLFPFIFDFLYKIVSESLYVTKIYEGFITRLKISLLIGVFFSIPVLLFELAAYIFPGLYKKERIIFLLILISAFILFLIGLYFSIQIVMPISMRFLKSRDFFPHNLNRIISYDAFVIFFTQFLIAFGLCFQFPVVVIILLYFKVLRVGLLIKYLKHFIAIIVLVSAILTPPDIISQLLLCVPLIFMYLLCILIGKLLDRKK